MAAVLVQLERQGQHPGIRGSGEERTSYAINQLAGRSVQQGCHCAQLKPPHRLGHSHHKLTVRLLQLFRQRNDRTTEFSSVSGTR